MITEAQPQRSEQEWIVDKSDEGAVWIKDGDGKAIAVLCTEQDDSQEIAEAIVAAHKAAIAAAVKKAYKKGWNEHKKYRRLAF